MGLYSDGTPMYSPDVMASMSLASAAFPPENITTEYIELPLNHFGTNSSSDGTFFNRFWVSTDAYKPGAPVFVYDAGESNAEWSVPTKLGRAGNFTNVFRSMVDRYQGIGIVWEHRYCESGPSHSHHRCYLLTSSLLGSTLAYDKKKEINGTQSADRPPETCPSPRTPSLSSFGGSPQSSP